MPIERAKAVCEVAQVIINSAKAENEFLKITGAKEGSGFIPTAPRGPLPLAIEGKATDTQIRSQPAQLRSSI